LIIVICALVISVCASYLVYRAVGDGKTAETAPPTVQLVVAARDLAVGVLLRDSDLSVSAWTGSPPKGAIRKRADVLNRGVLSPIYEGEPVMESRLAPKGSGGGLAATIPPGMRACAVKVNDVVGVAGFVVPGSRVDVLMTGVPPGGNATDGPRVRTLLQNIQVLSAGANFQRDQEGKPEQVQVVNLLVTPVQAESLSLASNETRIQLVLRNPMDVEMFTPPGRLMSELFSAERPRAPTPAVATRSSWAVARPPQTPPPTRPSEPYTIDVSNGAVHTTVKFARPAEAR
jgi:pilus assembly protein CpaB